MTMQRVARSPALLLSALLLPAMMGLSVTVMGNARADTVQPPANGSVSAASVLLIGGKPAGCEPALRTLGDRLHGQGSRGNNITMVLHPTGPKLRAALGRFAVELPPTGPVLVAYCGYAMADTDKLFLLPEDAAVTQPADLPHQAVLARAVLRILSTHDAIFVAELHMPAGGPSDAATLAPSIQSLREEMASGTHLDIEVAPSPDKAPLIRDFISRVSAAGDWNPLVASLDAPPPVATPEPAASQDAPKPAVAGDLPGAAAVTAPDASSADQSAPKAAASTAGARPSGAEPIDPAPTSADPAVAGSPRPSRPGLAAGSDPSSIGDPADVKQPLDPAGVKPLDPAATDVQKPRRPVRRGSPVIRRIQVGLLAHGLLKGRVTGFADANTQAAVRAYQTSLNHPATGFMTYQEMLTLDPSRQ